MKALIGTHEIIITGGSLVIRTCFLNSQWIMSIIMKLLSDSVEMEVNQKMRCIIIPSGLVFQATNTDDFNRVKDIIESNSTFNDIDYKTLSAVIYPENVYSI